MSRTAMSGLLAPLLIGSCRDDLLAQVRVPRLGEYARIRIVSDSTAPWTIGWVSGLSLNDLNLRVQQTGQEVALPLRVIHQFEIRRGTYLKEGALIGSALGLGIGLIAGESARAKLLLGATAGLSLGIAGAAQARRFPRWVTVDVAHLLSAGFGTGRVGLRISVSLR